MADRTVRIPEVSYRAIRRLLAEQELKSGEREAISEVLGRCVTIALPMIAGCKPRDREGAT